MSSETMIELFVSSSMRAELLEGVGRVIFTVPARGNPVDGPFCEALAEVAGILTTDHRVRAILIEAEGHAFSVGGDLKSFQGPQSAWPEDIRRKTSLLNTAVSALQTGDSPIVAAVNGICAGGMVALVAGCDFVLVGSDARFISAYAGIAFSCDVGASVMLPRRMGEARARRFLLLNENFGASEAVESGLADILIPGGELAKEAESLAMRLATGPTRSLGQLRRLLSAAPGRPLADQLIDESETLAALMATSDVHEGLMAFKERRRPSFRGQ